MPTSHFPRLCLLYHHHLRCERFCELAPIPRFVATVGPHPSHPTKTVFAKISPKPSITPFTNGKNMLMDNEEKKAEMRVRAGSFWSNIARVTDPAAAAAVVVVVARGTGECGREGSGNDMEGKDDVGESMLSHGGESDGSPVLACWPSGGAGRVWGAFELVDRCYVRTDTTQKQARKKSTQYTSSARNERKRGGVEKGKRTVPVWGNLPAANEHPHSHGHSRQGRCWC